MTQTIAVRDIGPIEEAEFTLPGYGVTELRGPQGVGKSTVLKAIQTLAAGKGRVPLRDGAKVGTVDAFGALLTISGRATHNGEFEVSHLEGRFDLSKLVDPGIADPKAADKARIKALLALTGARGDKHRFSVRPEFSDLEEVAGPKALDAEDLVDQAAQIKRAYEDAGRKAEEQATHADGHAKGCEEAAEGLDMDAERDAIVLQRAYDAARDRVSTYRAQRLAWEEAKTKADAAQKAIDATELPDLETAQIEFAAMTESVEQAKSRVVCARESLERAKAVLAVAIADAETADANMNAAKERLLATKAAHAHVADQRKLVDAFTGGDCPVTDEQLGDAEQDVRVATKAVECGTLIREAREKLDRAALHKSDAKRYRKRAETLRSAAKATDHVLSEAIQCDRLHVEAQEGVAVLMARDAEHGDELVPYARLSDGQRWKLAIDLGADQVGEGGLLVIPQGAWGELSAKSKRLVHERAAERKVYVLTAVATPMEADEGRGLEAVAYGEV